MSLRSCIPLNVKRPQDVPSGLGLNFSTKMTYFSQAVSFGCPVGFDLSTRHPPDPESAPLCPLQSQSIWNLEKASRLVGRQSKTRSVCKLQVTYGVILACKQVANPCFVPYPSSIAGGNSYSNSHSDVLSCHLSQVRTQSGKLLL